MTGRLRRVEFTKLKRCACPAFLNTHFIDGRGRHPQLIPRASIRLSFFEVDDCSARSCYFLIKKTVLDFIEHARTETKSKIVERGRRRLRCVPLDFFAPPIGISTLLGPPGTAFRMKANVGIPIGRTLTRLEQAVSSTCAGPGSHSTCGL